MNILEIVKNKSDAVQKVSEEILKDRNAVRCFVLENAKSKDQAEKTLGDYGKSAQDEKRVSALFEKQFKEFLETFRVWALCGGTVRNGAIPENDGHFSKILQCVSIKDVRKFQESEPSLDFLEKSYFTFSDIPKIAKTNIIPLVINMLDEETLTMALYNAAPEIQNVFFSFLSEKSAAILKEDIEFSFVSQKMMLDAREKIMDIVTKVSANVFGGLLRSEDISDSE